MRGLKLNRQPGEGGNLPSHALRVRGLKLDFVADQRKSVLSHALRVRGLKPLNTSSARRHWNVARSTRAWIETSFVIMFLYGLFVARSTRAWIETNVARSSSVSEESHALRVRGLKL